MIFILGKHRLCSVSGLFRCLSAYPQHYIEPIFSKETQVDLEKRELVKLNYVATKPARNDESVSIFYNQLAQKMTNYITRNGRKDLGREIFVKSLECIKRIQIERVHLSRNDDKQQIVVSPEELLIKAIENSRPLLQLSSIKRGGVKYQVPIPITIKRSYFLAMKWLLEASRDKERKIHLPEKLAWEILDAAHGQGRVVKKKDDFHRQCESNRAYAHYRWS